jgi:hypothetical protein|tara:strand:- start:195 stop:392 length:198 start_codon:yes stop_codon:yes gene_type:complete
MDVNNFISDIGGRKILINSTGLTKGRISQWVTGNHIPRPWIKFLVQKFPTECSENGIIDLEKAVT